MATPTFMLKQTVLSQHKVLDVRTLGNNSSEPDRLCRIDRHRNPFDRLTPQFSDVEELKPSPANSKQKIPSAEAKMPFRHCRYDLHPGSPLEVCAEIVRAKWKGPILFYLLEGPKRFNELRRLFPEVTQRVLTRQLRQLEGHGIVTRSIYAQVPPKVEYSLSDLGHSLCPIIHAMRHWGATYLQQRSLSEQLTVAD